MPTRWTCPSWNCVTTGFDVNGLLVQGGGAICASLDVAGAQYNVSSRAQAP
ncbi:MAG: hypothetical protein IPG10_20845 [Flavobacteriales bacterium]|nr:hypothetical protein [Flavobacteriales bacterium]